MKALHLLNLIKVGGGQSVALNYSIILKELGIISVFCGKRFHDETFAHHLEKYGEVTYDLTLVLVKQSDIIFIHTNRNLLELLKIKLTSNILDNKQIIYIQHLNYPKQKLRLLSIVINYVCTDFIQITPITTKYIERFININKHFIVNFKLLSYKENEWNLIRQKVRRDLGYSDDDVVYIYSSRFMEGKNVSKFLELAKSAVECTNMKFLLLGDGPENDDAKQYKADNYKWLGFQSDVERYLIASDVYLFVSLYKFEMLPMALVEAINYNLSIAAYDTEINKFLLNSMVYKDINLSLIKNWEVLPNGKDLLKYNQKYALAKISNLIKNNNESYNS